MLEDAGDPGHKNEPTFRETEGTAKSEHGLCGCLPLDLRKQDSSLFAALVKWPKTHNSCQKSWILVPQLPQPVVCRLAVSSSSKASDPLPVN